MTRFSTLITKWYRQNARELPWRDTNDPYLIWLSEIILQQTRVEQGLSYYIKFANKYPTVNDLAKAEQIEVLNLWQGLGYYSRARNMQAAAQSIVTDFGGVFPDNYRDIRALKGVGDYTAAAIASFAYNLPHAVVDGNVYRLLARYLNISEPIDTGAGKKLFAELAQELLDLKNPAQHNQAIMEMGALVCTPKNPTCDICPLNNSCMAKDEDTIDLLPVKTKKTKVRDRFFHYLIVKDKQQVLLKKRGVKDVWEGLYDFPLIELKRGEDITETAKKLGVELISDEGEYKHILSHQRIYASFWIAKYKEPSIEEKNYIKVEIADLVDYPMPQLLIRYLDSSGLFKTN